MTGLLAGRPPIWRHPKVVPLANRRPGNGVIPEAPVEPTIPRPEERPCTATIDPPKTFPIRPLRSPFSPPPSWGPRSRPPLPRGPRTSTWAG